MRHTAKNFLCALAALALISGGASAAGRTTADFLTINPDPKATALGEGAVADVSGLPTAAYANPAGLLGLSRPWLSLNYSAYPGDLQYHFSSFAVPTAYGNIGASLGFLTYKGIEGYNNDFSRASVDSSYDLAFMMTYALPLRTMVPVYREHGAVGVNVKFAQSKLTSYLAESLALDVGGIYHVPFVEGLSVGAAYRNLGSDMKFVKKPVPIPSSLDLGLAYRNPALKNLLAVFDYHLPDHDRAFTSLGLSITPAYFLTLRAGYRQTENSLLSDIRGGFGLQFGDFSLDYAYTPFAYFNPLHQLSLSMAIGSILKLEAASDYYLEQHFQQACEYYYRKDYVEARQQFEEILSVFPSHRPSQRFLEKIMEAMDDMEEQKEKKLDYYLQKAGAATDRRDFVTSRRYYNYVLALSPDNEEARVGLEKNWQMLEEIKQEKARERNLRRIERFWKKGLRYYQKGEFVLSKDQFNEILLIDPNNQDAAKFIVEIDNQLSKIAADKISELYVQATTHYRAGNYRDAIKYFEAVLVAAPRRMDAQDFILKCRQNLQEQEEKERAANLAREQVTMKEEMELTYDRALKLYEKGNYKSALDYFVKSDGLATRYEFNEYIDNIKSYIGMIKISLADDHYRKGFDYFRRNRFEAAAQEYRKALEYNPDNTSARLEMERIGKDLAQKYYEEGMAYFSRSEMRKAKEMFQKSLYYQPDKAESRRALDRVQE